jgi:vacuolar-type H+-ATPase subunit E/Vma4
MIFMSNNSLGVVIGIGGLAFSTYILFKLIKMADTVDTAAEELSHEVNVDVKTVIVEKAIQKAVDREVNEQIGNAVRETINQVSKDISLQVKKAVDASYSDIKSSVSSELYKQVSNLNINTIKQEIVNKAREDVLRKFEGSLDEVLNEFNGNLHNVSKIYETIANSMTKSQAKETVFKIG